MKTLSAGVTEGQTLTSDLEIGCDVCIIGSGPGGAVAAQVLSEKGLSVVVLEEGGYFTKERFRQREDEAYPYLYQDGAQRTTKDTAIAIMQGKSVGGGSTVNWTTSYRTPNDVVDTWRTKHACAGVSVEELNPHWDWIEKRLSIAEIPLELVNRNNRVLWDGAKALNLEVHLLKRNVVGCAHTGNCGHGCPIDAKQSMAVTLLPDAMKSGAAVLSRCRVNKIVFEGGRAVAVEGALLDAFGRAETGLLVTVKPRAVVVSCGAINSPALLLRSGAPDESGMLGRRTFLHPGFALFAMFEEQIRAYTGAPQSVASHAFSHRGDEVGYFLEAAPIHPMLASIALPGFGADHRNLMKLLPYAAAPVGLIIDGFHDDIPGGTVSLSPTGKPILDYPIPQRVWRGIRDALTTLAKIAFAAGAKQVATSHDPMVMINSATEIDKINSLPFEPCRTALFSMHQMGGCMMSDDPKKGVVRSTDLRHHQIQNLHVIDGSVFPTSLGVNPQESIYGLARLASTRLSL